MNPLAISSPNSGSQRSLLQDEEHLPPMRPSCHPKGASSATTALVAGPDYQADDQGNHDAN